ncbi:Serine/threonine-protein kinase HT1 OS=Arabidopsis thaliana GN=HT1 PE=1 SV=1 [Rhizoctonia solani AG-1 IB]|uniref:Serine/threonine-protein kinase HT1 n=1 Tax=Thanatephorus cucumeris (strain AG1-IB / isolate 7/3/14) TaxID=1108050 RepID=A0A0B7G4P4_THACB|nr:Serine/threonine-protein kinase HT1 OS=Arabidopsis thaliana GN=HT1 PE=1 SV=1 [Rhizoctonia solani AG-1 IB]
MPPGSSANCEKHCDPTDFMSYETDQFVLPWKKHFHQGPYSDVICTVLNALKPPELVMVKGIRAMNEQDPEEFVRNELNIWRLLNKNKHPHIVPFLGITTLDRWPGAYTPPLAVCRYYEAGTPREFLSKRKPGCETRLELLIGIARGVEHIHNQSVVHGDLKADNTVIEASGDKLVAKITDFGSSRLNCQRCTNTNDQAGTILWDSPEVTLEESGRTFQSDIWALGCIALEVQLDAFPYTAGARRPNDRHLLKVMARQRRGDPPAKKTDFNFEGREISENVWVAFQDCWSVDPSERPSAGDLADRLEALCLPTGHTTLEIDDQVGRIELEQRLPSLVL